MIILSSRLNIAPIFSFYNVHDIYGRNHSAKFIDIKLCDWPYNFRHTVYGRVTICSMQFQQNRSHFHRFYFVASCALYRRVNVIEWEWANISFTHRNCPVCVCERLD